MPEFKRPGHLKVWKALESFDSDSLAVRDIIDLAFMVEGWGVEAALTGRERAIEAYGEVVVTSLKKVANKLESDSAYFRHCLRELSISDSSLLRGGLRALSQHIGG